LGDTLLQIAGQAVRYPEELFGLLGGERIGTLVSVRVLRAGAPQDLSVTVGERLRKSA
jgi:serine protease DegQ